MKDLMFFRGKMDVSSFGSLDVSIKEKYGIMGIDMNDYGTDVILVLVEMESPKYGKYYYHRFVRMYNVPDDIPLSGSNP